MISCRKENDTAYMMISDMFGVIVSPKGEIPTLITEPDRFFSPDNPIRRVNIFLRRKYTRANRSVTPCPRIVASAAPARPCPNPQTNR